MAHGRDKHRSRANRKRVRALLMEHWDPIGVRDYPGCEDEYDNYADRAYVMLMDERATREELAAFLIDVVTNYMGLGDQPHLRESSERVAKMLTDLRPEFESP